MQINDEPEKKTRDKSIADYNRMLEAMMPRAAAFLVSTFQAAAEKPYRSMGKGAKSQKAKAKARAEADKARQEQAKKMMALARKIDNAGTIKDENARLVEYDKIRSELLKEPKVQGHFGGERPFDEERPDEMWNFHWAGVVLRDGTDYVTLENLSTEFASDINTNWYFRMYGTPTQQDQGTSFHEEAGSDSHVGEYPLTIPFRTFPASTQQAEIGVEQVKAFTAQQGKLKVGELYKLAKTKKLAKSTMFNPSMKVDVLIYVGKNDWIKPYIDPEAAEILELV